MPTGYSGTPLPKKLGITAATRVSLVGITAGDYAALAAAPDGVTPGTSVTAKTDVVHVFATRREVLSAHLARLRKTLRDDAAVWVSWPKKAAKVPTTITEDVIREVALPLGFVDIKVCAVSDVWSGLKLVVRRELRGVPGR